MRGRFAKLLVVILLIVSVGGHWAFLQSIAWATMVVDYSKGAPLAVAVAKTFDGKNPCELCHFVKRGQENEKKQEAIKVKTKLDFWFDARSSEFKNRQSARAEFLPFVNHFSGRSDSPAIPPPRLA